MRSLKDVYYTIDPHCQKVLNHPKNVAKGPLLDDSPITHDCNEVREELHELFEALLMKEQGVKEVTIKWYEPRGKEHTEIISIDEHIDREVCDIANQAIRLAGKHFRGR